MREWTALYYPNVEPPLAWLRSAALFFDSITSFVPRESDDHLSDELRQFAETTGAWAPHRPDEQTAMLVDVPVERLDEAFSAIAEAHPHPLGRIELEFVADLDGMRIRDHVFMHGSKLSPTVREHLTAYDLMLPKALAEPLMQGDWWIVNEKASDLILAHIADNLAARRGWTSITDNEPCYAFNAVDWTKRLVVEREAESQLAKVMVSELVPDGIESLSSHEYVEVRRRYEAIRNRLAAFFNDVIVENRLSRIGDPADLRDGVVECVADLCREVETFRETPFGRAVRKWTAFSLGGLVTLAGAALPGPHWAFPLAGVNVILSAVDKAVSERTATNRSEMVRLLASARNDIIGAINAPRDLIGEWS